jgi:hypothetical protein
MKKIVYLLTLILIFGITSCGPDNGTEPTPVKAELIGDWKFVAFNQENGVHKDESGKQIATYTSYSVNPTGNYKFMDNDTIEFSYGFTHKILTTNNGAPQPTVQTIEVAEKSYISTYEYNSSENSIGFKEAGDEITWSIQKHTSDTLKLKHRLVKVFQNGSSEADVIVTLAK